MEDSDLKALWTAGKQVSRIGWTAEAIDSFRRRRSSSLASYLRRRLWIDLVLKAFIAIAIGVAVSMLRQHSAGVLISLAALLATLALALPVATAIRALAGPGHQADDVRAASAALLTAVHGFRRWPLLALAATSSLAPLAFVLIYSAAEYGSLRPDLFTLALVVLPFFATLWVIDTRLRSAFQTLSACLGELDPEALKTIVTARRRSQIVLHIAVAVFAIVLLAGVIVLVVRY